MEQTQFHEAAAPHDPENTLPTPLPSIPSWARTDAVNNPEQTVEAGPPIAAPRTFDNSPERTVSTSQMSTTGRGPRPVAVPSAPSSQVQPTPYTIIRLHASGGLGCVNLARDEAIQREVALKQIQPHLADNYHSRTRFVTEAKITGQLEHPGIVPVYAMGTDDAGHPYYVMKFVRGRTLDEVISEYFVSPNPLVFRELLRRFVTVCQAIAYAHSRGIIHRDIKPQNIMLGDYGETLVLDWGLAKDMKDKSSRSSDMSASSNASSAASSQLSGIRPAPLSNSLTLDGQVIGTPAYMSPEQASGHTELHGPATDIYSLGAVLYKMLTSKAPNTGKSTASSNLRTYQAPPKPSSVRPDIHPELERICAKAMAEHPEERYQRAMELSQEVQRWLDDVPLRRRRASLVMRVWRWVKENPLHVVVWIALLLAVFLTLIAVAMMNQNK